MDLVVWNKRIWFDVIKTRTSNIKAIVSVMRATRHISGERSNIMNINKMPITAQTVTKAPAHCVVGTLQLHVYYRYEIHLYDRDVVQFFHEFQLDTRHLSRTFQQSRHFPPTCVWLAPRCLVVVLASSSRHGKRWRHREILWPRYVTCRGQECRDVT